MKPKLYLHAGTQKTGTTALQRFASVNRSELKARGLWYPDYQPFPAKPRSGHHDFAYALAEGEISHLSLDEVGHLSELWCSKAKRAGLVTLISVEAIYRLRNKNVPYNDGRNMYLQRVAHFLEQFDVEVLLVFRRPDNYIRSLYQEVVTKFPKRREPFERWAASPKRFGIDYHANASLIKKVFPNVTCFIYEDLIDNGDFFTRFFTHMGIDVSGLKDPGTVRKSLNTVETMLKNYANQFLRNAQESRAFLAWMRSQEIQYMISELCGSKDSDLWSSHENRKRFLSNRQTDIDALREGFFPSRKQLFPVLRESETGPHMEGLPSALLREIDRWCQKEGIPVNN